MRMIRTLACLVVAMTGTSSLLQWLDPPAASTIAARGGISTEQIRAVDGSNQQSLIAGAVRAIDDGVEVSGGSRAGSLRESIGPARKSVGSLREWHGVHVVGGPASLSVSMLAATPVATPWHFRVRQDGRVDVSAKWRRQLPVAIAGAQLFPNTICVQVSGVKGFSQPAARVLSSVCQPAPRASRPLCDAPAAQQLALRTLVAELSRIVTPVTQATAGAGTTTSAVAQR